MCGWLAAAKWCSSGEWCSCLKDDPGEWHPLVQSGQAAGGQVDAGGEGHHVGAVWSPDGRGNSHQVKVNSATLHGFWEQSPGPKVNMIFF